MWRKRVICTLMAFGLCATAVRAEPEPACQVQPGMLRYEDKIDCFLDPAARTGFPRPLKFIPLDGGGDAYVSFGGEIRQLYEYTHDPLFGEYPQDEAGVWMQRYTLHGDLRLGPH